MIWEELGKEDITIYELNMWCNKYQEEHPDVYLCHTRADLNHAHGCGFIWHEIKHEGSDILHKQESIVCPVCGDKHYKYPDTKKFEKIVGLNELLGKK